MRPRARTTRGSRRSRPPRIPRSWSLYSWSAAARAVRSLLPSRIRSTSPSSSKRSPRCSSEKTGDAPAGPAAPPQRGLAAFGRGLRHRDPERGLPLESGTGTRRLRARPSPAHVGRRGHRRLARGGHLRLPELRARRARALPRRPRSPHRRVRARAHGVGRAPLDSSRPPDLSAVRALQAHFHPDPSLGAHLAPRGAAELPRDARLDLRSRGRALRARGAPARSGYRAGTLARARRGTRRRRRALAHPRRVGGSRDSAHAHRVVLLEAVSAGPTARVPRPVSRPAGY